MGRRRRSSSKKNNKCNICNKLYASRQSLYFHNYTYHKHQANEINIDNNVEIYHNIDNSDNDFESVINNEGLKTFDEHIDNHLISNYIKKINIVKDAITSKISNLNIQEKNTDEENKQIIEETKPVQENKQIVEETKPVQQIIEEIKPVQENKQIVYETKPVKEIKQIVEEKKQVKEIKSISEEKIINDVTLLLNNCISNNIGISINVELSNSTITVINKLKN